MNKHDTCGTQQDLRGGQWQKRHQEVSGHMPNHVRRFWTILRNLGWLEEQYHPGYGQVTNSSTAASYVFCHYNKTAPQRQAHAPPGAVMFVHSDNENTSKTVPVNDWRQFTDVTWYRCQEMRQYAGNCLSSTANARLEVQSLQIVLTMTQ